MKKKPGTIIMLFCMAMLNACAVKTYEFSIAVSTGGSVDSLGGMYKAGETICVTALPETGYFFSGWYIDDFLVSTEMSYSFTMPKENLGIECRFLQMRGGSGTELDPYNIFTAEQLIAYTEKINNRQLGTGKYYALKSDIDLGGRECIPIGRNTDSFDGRDFAGIFDGQGHVISNFKISAMHPTGVSGLFGANIGEIKNLGVENFIVDVSSLGSNYQERVVAGGLVGVNEGTITNCYAIGLVKATTSNYSRDAISGGLVGQNYGGTISNSFAGVSVVSYTRNDSSNSIAGGFTGKNQGQISNCFATGNVCAKIGESSGYKWAYAGGLVGTNGSIINSYRYEGQLIESDVEDQINDFGAQCNLLQLNNQLFYKNDLSWSNDVWDFTGVNISNSSYPKLKKHMSN